MATLKGWDLSIVFGLEHTYVTSSDGGVWPCWGRSDGGEEICSGSGSSLRADCLYQGATPAGIIYGFSGVCHQTANRVLWAGNGKPTVANAGGYWLSWSLYGTYGSRGIYWSEWRARKSTCKKKDGDFEHPSETLAGTEEPAAGMADFLTQEDTIYAKVEENDMSTDEALAEEWELMVNFRLGAGDHSQTIATLQKLQSDLLRGKEALERALTENEIAADEFANEINRLMEKFMEEGGRQLGIDLFTKLFGIAPDADFRVVDPEIMVKSREEL